MSSAGMGALSDGCPQYVVQHQKYQNMSDILWSIVPSNNTLNLLTNIPYTFSNPCASRDSVVCYSLFPCQLSSAVGSHNP